MTHTIPCRCAEPGFCPVYQRDMAGRPHAICSGQTNLPPEKVAAYQRTWLELSGQVVHPEFCLHRGKQLRTEICHVCGNRGKEVPVYECNVFGSCSLDAHHIGQLDHVCRGCDRFSGPLKSQWDRRVEQLIPSPDKQNFNCSLIEFRGRRIMAYRHRWGAAQIGLCELDREWGVQWNAKLQFPRVPRNVYQEDPRLFLYQGELHVAFTAVEANFAFDRESVHVGYARLKETAPSCWDVDEVFLPQYAQRRLWEKNWGFFESQGQLWAVYDARRQTILAIDGSRAELAFDHGGPTIPGPLGEIRGGASPQFWRGEFYSFVHFRRPPKNYTGGLYTFDAMPPFSPVSYVPYPFLTPTAEHCRNPHAAHVVYPCGAALIDWRWVISYGAYDRDSRLVAYDVNETQAALVRHPEPAEHAHVMQPGAT